MGSALREVAAVSGWRHRPGGALHGPAAAAEHLDRAIRAGQTPGVEYLFLDEAQTLFSYRGGAADLQHQVAVGQETTFLGYSVTKTLTAAAILKLAAEGRLELDAPIASFLTEFPYARSPTILQTLTHSGGFPNPIPLRWVHLPEAEGHFDEQAFVQRVLREHPKLKAEPGERYSYSNVGYLLLGEVARRVSGRPYTDYVTRELIDPLSLRPNERLGFAIPDPATHARGYLRRWSLLNLALGWFIDREAFLDGHCDGWVQFKDVLVDGKAYGGLVANGAGFARYLQALLRKEPPFTAELVEQLLAPRTTRKGERLPVGISWFHGELHGEPYFTHAGGGGGYYCEVRIYPRIGRASVVLFNRTGIADERYLDQVDAFFIDGAPGT